MTHARQTIYRAMSASLDGSFRVWDARQVILSGVMGIPMSDVEEEAERQMVLRLMPNSITVARDASLWIVFASAFWTEDDARTYLRDHEDNQDVIDVDAMDAEQDDDPAYLAYRAEMDRMCGADYTTAGHDPYGTNCDLDKGHKGDHAGPDPMGNGGRITWTGGGWIAGDRVPAHVTSSARQTSKWGW